MINPPSVLNSNEPWCKNESYFDFLLFLWRSFLFSHKKIYLRWEKKFISYLVCKSWNKMQALLILLSLVWSRLSRRLQQVFTTSSFSCVSHGNGKTAKVRKNQNSRTPPSKFFIHKTGKDLFWVSVVAAQDKVRQFHTRWRAAPKRIRFPTIKF